MINLLVNNEMINVKDVFYHYKAPFNGLYEYSLTITLDEVNIIKFIENYSGCDINDPKLNIRILEKDKKRLSLGLIWNIFTLMEKLDKLSHGGGDIIWVLNNIRYMEKKNNSLIIKGNASINELWKDSFEKIDIN